MKPLLWSFFVGLALSSVGCGGGGASFPPVMVEMPRQTAVWIGEEGADEVTVADLTRVGVDEVVVRRGTVSVTGGLPVLRPEPAPPVAGGIATGVLLRLHSDGAEVDDDQAAALWRSMGRELSAGGAPVELLIELPRVMDGLEAFFGGLSEASGLDVIPVVTVPQLSDERVCSLAEQVGSCVVVAVGQLGWWRDGLSASAEPLRKQLAPLALQGVAVRLGIVVRPRTSPEVPGWGRDLNPITEGEVSRIETETALDRSFTVLEKVTWSGLEWSEGARVDVGWIDVSRLDAYLSEASHVTLPMFGGVDLLWLPPTEGGELGMTREGLVEYLDGRGPGPEIDAEVERSGSRVRVSLTNRSPFPTAVTGYGNWVEVAVKSVSLVALDQGQFDRILLGRRTGAEFEPASAEDVNAVRLLERYVAPGETVASGWLTTGSRRNGRPPRWQVTLSSGAVVSGTGQP